MIALPRTLLNLLLVDVGALKESSCAHDAVAEKTFAMSSLCAITEVGSQWLC